MIDLASIRVNLDRVKERIEIAATKAGRDPTHIRLVVVTKGHPAEVITALVDLGTRDIGESFAEEGRAKQLTLGFLPAVKWHMIGHVQSRKAATVAAHFDLVHSVDSLKLAQRLDRFAAEADRLLPVLLECKISADTNKTGWPILEVGEQDKFLDDAAEIVKSSNLEVMGLMSIAPEVEKADQARPYFATTRRMLEELASRLPSARWKHLSMGMSGDFEAAIAEGATLVRIGTAILGPRPQQ